MLKRTILALAAFALLFPMGAVAQESATFTLKSGEKLNGQLIDHGGVGFTVRVNNEERRIPTGEVAVIDFTGGGDMTASDWAKFSGSSGVLLRNGQAINGQLHDVSGTSPLKILLKTDSGEREISSSEIARIVLARPAVATSGSSDTQVPAGDGIAVPANQRWTPTGITVRRGEVVNFSSTGEARLSGDSADVAHASGALSQRRAQNAPMPQHFAGALIGRIGNGEPFFIGGSNSLTMPAAGQLFLSLNDDDVNDNQGGFRVTIQRTNRRR
jgi:hypothetical protein